MDDEIYFPEERAKIAFNIADKHKELIANFIMRAASSYAKGDLGNWYWTLTGLKENVFEDLKKDEIEVLDAMEKEIKPYYSSWNTYIRIIAEGAQPSMKIRIQKENFFEKVKLYQRKLRIILKALGYIPSKEDRTKLSF